MMVEIKVPAAGESVHEGDIARWFKSDGDYVEMDEPLLELETDKASLEVTAEAAGQLHTQVAQGETVKVGQVIGQIDTEAAADSGNADDGGTKDDDDADEDAGKYSTVYNVHMPSPAARKLMAENQLSAKDIEGSGRGGRITKADVLRHLEEIQRNQKLTGSYHLDADDGAAGEADAADEATASAPSAPRQSPPDGPTALPQSVARSRPLSPGLMAELGQETWEPRRRDDDTTPSRSPSSAGTRPVSLNSEVANRQQPGAGPKAPAPTGTTNLKPAAAPAVTSGGTRETRTEPMSRIRKTIAAHLLEAQQTAAILTTFNEVDMSAIKALRARYKDPFKEKHGVGLGFMSFFTRACALALLEFPDVNARIDGEHVVYHDYCDIGIAVSTERGLVVPMLRNAETLDFAAIEQGIVELAQRARDGKLSLDDLSGGTFSITNGGIFGSMLSTPIINRPQSAILGMHNIVDRPVAVAGQVVVRPVMYLALSYDHRLIDGKAAVSFLVRVKQLLEDPSRLLLGV